MAEISLDQVLPLRPDISLERVPPPKGNAADPKQFAREWRRLLTESQGLL